MNADKTSKISESTNVGRDFNIHLSKIDRKSRTLSTNLSAWTFLEYASKSSRTHGLFNCTFNIAQDRTYFRPLKQALIIQKNVL